MEDKVKQAILATGMYDISDNGTIYLKSSATPVPLSVNTVTEILTAAGGAVMAEVARRDSETGQVIGKAFLHSMGQDHKEIDGTYFCHVDQATQDFGLPAEAYQWGHFFHFRFQNWGACDFYVPDGYGEIWVRSLWNSAGSSDSWFKNTSWKKVGGN